MRYLLIMIHMMMMLSCSNKDQNNQVVPIANFDTSIFFFLQNEVGEDLLDPTHPNGYDHSEVKVYQDVDLMHDITSTFLLNGEESIIYGPNEIGSATGYVITLFGKMSNEIAEDLFENVLYLKLSDTDVDTLYFEVTSTRNGAYVSKFKFNEKVIFKDSESRSKWNNVVVK